MFLSAEAVRLRLVRLRLLRLRSAQRSTTQHSAPHSLNSFLSAKDAENTKGCCFAALNSFYPRRTLRARRVLLFVSLGSTPLGSTPLTTAHHIRSTLFLSAKDAKGAKGVFLLAVICVLRGENFLRCFLFRCAQLFLVCEGLLFRYSQLFLSAKDANCAKSITFCFAWFDSAHHSAPQGSQLFLSAKDAKGAKGCFY